ncbi:TIGR03032 family protein [Halioxenophilus aromaticivorans]|uniref:TIGR03032 family protein n=1 Tax=Halioxenophilus aromaticivorans TaxID=1306992 RepID=A0AAV3U1F9_9ALTE
MANSASDLGTQPLRSVFTSTLLDIFKQLNISLVVSTYQAGKVILVRHDQTTNAINTHFRNFAKPMGIAVKDNRLCIGGTNTVWEYRNLPAVAAKLEPSGKHDACYLPSSSHITGDIDVHEMAWSEDNQLWLVNTRFDCLCTIDTEHSFTPRWRPSFISALAPEDRCHLNGMALVNGKPKYVTALGKSDTAQGWRDGLAKGGVLIDIETNQTLLAGLSMPHSPRWHQDCLWLLESGKGALTKVDINSGASSAVANLSGFTRGLDFYGPLAFIGLSQVRESASFGAIPLVAETEERTCGVWVVHVETGQTLGFLRFESGVEEIFDVQIIPHSRFPELLEWDDPKVNSSYVIPEEALAKVSPSY